MKFKRFDTATLPQNNTRKGMPKISLGKKGLVTVNQFGADMLGYKHGTKIALVQDEESPDDYYITEDAEHGYELRGKTEGGKGLMFNHRQLCETIIDALQLDSNVTHSFFIAETPTVVNKKKVLLPVITLQFSQINHV